MPEDVLRPYPRARGRRQDRAFADLLLWLDGHPLSLRLLLPQLETVSAASLERQRRTMGRLLGFALSAKRYAEAQALMQPLNELWNVRGLSAEARGWVDRCRKALEAADGAPPDLASAAGASSLKQRAHRDHEPDEMG